MSCRIVVFDGTTTVVIENVPTLGAQFIPAAGGGAPIRFLDGTLGNQRRWQKEEYSISGEGRMPSGLRDLDYAQLLTLTIETSLGSDVYTGYSSGASETWNLTGGTISWNMTIQGS